ncbi:ABC transporter permease [Stappia stellulata]|uniref:ABC transporter permease n=1 Tax=Stappia stellulata TaxID=71235 RepID=UPI001CD5FD9F|nr:ABC transporter permease [Stappia stellulata]MCA1242101.1 ABC transporter permease [Stappia stellulata]
MTNDINVSPMHTQSGASQRLWSWLGRAGSRLYLFAFVGFLLGPLAILGGAAFNDSSFPTVSPWQGGTLKWLQALFHDGEIGDALVSSGIVAGGVILVSLPVGLASALVLNSLNGRARGFVYGLMVSPMLIPGIVIGISTLLFWRQVGVNGGYFLTILAQASFITSFVMLMIAAQLQRFDRTMEDAALGLGASRLMVLRRILLPYLRPAVLAACCLAFLQSFENYNTTLFVRGTETPLTVFIATKVRTGLTPVINALGLVMMLAALIGALLWELKRMKGFARADRS